MSIRGITARDLAPSGAKLFIEPDAVIKIAREIEGDAFDLAGFVQPSAEL